MVNPTFRNRVTTGPGSAMVMLALISRREVASLASPKRRDSYGSLDSAFTTLVLDIEQKKLNSQAGRAAFILSKQGQLMSPADFQQGV